MSRTDGRAAPVGRSRRLGALPKAARRLLWLSEQLWARVLAIAGLALVAIAAAKLLDPLVADRVAGAVGAGALAHLLDILANTMLTVTTFTLSVIVAVHWAASGQLTHRAHRELLADTVTQNVLATFVGAWIFALTAIVLTSTPFFGEKELVALFAVTILVLGLIVAAVLRWVLHLQTLGSLLDTAAEMQASCMEAIWARPALDTHVLDAAAIPPAARPIRAEGSGYVRAIYEDALQAAAERGGARVYLLAQPGRFVVAGQVLAWADGGGEGFDAEVRAEVEVGAVRSAEQDPRFGAIQLSEVGSKALSPAVNDPGTAIDILGRLSCCLLEWRAREPRPPRHNRLWAVPVPADELVADAFDAIARDGARLVEVQVTLQKRVAGLLAHGDPELAPGLRAVGRRALDRALAVLDFEPDRDRLRAAVAEGVRE